MSTEEGAERSRSIALWLTLAILTLVLVVLGGNFLEPSPPKMIVLAAGQVDGGYYAFGREYQKRLARLGLRVEVAASNGSVENLHRLVDGRADVAFVQGEPLRWCRIGARRCADLPFSTANRFECSTADA